MRKSLLLLLFFGLLVGLSSCQKDETSSMEQNTTSTLTVTIPQGIETKAAADYGTGSKINRCILEIYRNGNLYGERRVAAVTGTQVTFNGLQLIESQTYDFVLWADCGDGMADKYYNTTTLSAVTVNTDNKAYTGNDDGFDAFYAKETYQVEGSFSKEITLRRPFGQLTVQTNDLGTITHDDLKPAQVKVAFVSIPTTFNVLTGESGGSQDITYIAPIEDAATGDLTIDYILAAPEQAELSDFTMTFLSADGTEITTNDSFHNIPIRRNYRTNVSGNLVTKRGTLNVTIDTEFNQPDIEGDYPELRNVLANGGTCTLTQDVEVDAPLVVEGDKTVEINLNGYDIINMTSIPDASDSRYGNTTVFEVKGDATLNIRGEGNIQAISTKPNEDGYRMAVYAYGDSKVNIYGGNFYNDQDYNDHNAQLDLIYADQNAVINIYGGRFESSSANYRGYWVLNLKDDSNAAINVYGGTFVNFDPSNSMTENPVKNFVVPTSTTVKISDTPVPNGTYEVVPEGEHVSVPIAVNDAASLTKALSSPAISQIVVTTDIDLSEATLEELTFAEHKTLEIAEGATIQLGKQNRITAENGLTLIGKGTIDNTSADNSDLGEGVQQKSLIHVMSGDCIVDGVTLINDTEYHWHGDGITYPYNSAAISYWNDANVTVKNATIISGEFTICGMGRSTASGTITLTDSYFESTSSNKDNGTHYAYAMRLYGSKVRIDNCEVKGIQGAVSIEGCQDAVISSGKYYTVNSPGNTDAFYPLYITNGAIVTITGGEFSGANVRSSLPIEGTSAVVSGDNDVGLPTGSVILQGGSFSGKAYNHVTGVVYEPASGYQWQAITGSDNLKWEVVPAE